MATLHSWQSGTALLMALGITTGAVAPLIAQPAQAQTAFSDVQSNYWAAEFIDELSDRGVIRGFPDGSFRPNDPVTRAQFAAMVRQAFDRNPTRSAINFRDVPSNYWAYSAIQEAYTTGFLSGYPNNVFQPNQNIPREQVLVSLSSGLNYAVNGSATTALSVYRDASSISNFAVNGVAAATQKQIVVNYPNVEFLSPNRSATRAEVAAFIYQALVSTGQVASVESPYIVGQVAVPTQPQTVQIPRGTVLPIRYADDADKIYISPEEPEPVPVTLTIDRDVVSQSGTVLIPVNSQVVGELRPVNGGVQFFAREIVLTNNRRLSINASSQIVTTTETIRRGADAGRIISGAALGAAAAAAIAGVTGDDAIATEEVLGGTVAGTLLSIFFGRERATLYVINPNDDLDLTLNAPLTLQ
ncbi:S-layer homology domain-containing protein [Microcoleus sp. FACHB-1515]|uniref:S-layer homology domain-containing protein n=1 Tax=Cyanophyceae TaxID=3028117 RepID=UPI001685CB51|nr:S-layer homology domain-containing protein [Microcoleus sp. FACHB-1515]MBD2092692.1 S-layer homology domain-containing protein [Microcoleus sp. FACHB-1515]